MLETSQELASLFEALSAFQGACGAPKKTSTNPHFKSKFADLAEVVETVKKPLADNGLSYLQFPVGDCEGGRVTIITQLNHKSGQWMRSSYSMPVPQNNPQAVGTAISYARRYALQAILGIAADDDDGNESSGRSESGKAKEPPKTTAVPAHEPHPLDPSGKELASGKSAASTPPAAPITAEQKDKMRGLLRELGATNAPGANEICKRLVGLTLSEVTTEALAHDLIIKLGNEGIRMKQEQP